MARNSKQSVLFKHIVEKPITFKFNRPAQSSDGGAVLLKGVDRNIGLSKRMAEAITDARQQCKIRHSIHELVQERVFAIACGYPDCNDAAMLGSDPVMKMICGRPPLKGEALASQPTLSRFENSVRRTDLLRLGYAMADTVIEAQRRRRRGQKVRKITIDADPFCDPTYGQQQLAFFNGGYDCWCYLPMAVTMQFGKEPEQFALSPVLRPGNAGGTLAIIGILRRLVGRLRQAFPKARLYVRLDCAFATTEVLQWLEQQNLLYAVTMQRNAVLERLAHPLLLKAHEAAKRSEQTETLFGEAEYKARKWKCVRRVIIKGEVVQLKGRSPRPNPRFVITNMHGTPKGVYQFYSGRGDMENRIKEMKYGLEIDRTSCTRFEANQVRNLLSTAAYILFQHLRQDAAQTELGRAQVCRLRETLLKIGVSVSESVRRIVLEGPRHYPWLGTFRRLASAYT